MVLLTDYEVGLRIFFPPLPCEHVIDFHRFGSLIKIIKDGFQLQN